MADDKQLLLGVGVTSASREEVLKRLESSLVSRGRDALVMVVTPNPEQVVQANEDDSFRSILNKSEISVPDGMGLVVAARLINRIKNKDLRIKQITRIAGIDLAEELVGFCRSE